MKKNGERLSELVERALVIGEEPYQANRRALRNFDVLEDVDKGNQELELISSGIDAFVGELQEVENAAKLIARHAASFL
jgi:hypothetical protein